LKTLSAPIVHTLMPGDVVCADRSERLETLLGSCVSIVLTDRRRTIGAMCHIVHCRPAAAAAEVPGAYADTAVKTMYTLLRGRGFSPELCEAFVYGGGRMYPALAGESHVGENNGRWALERLAHDGVRVLFHDLGGARYRRLAWTIGPKPPEVISVAV
jgi:chemotaxis protein CheD